ncbi:hypothetical protein SBOR_5843 [Sclerotinia borealis F-4128]|uniref:Extracellular membrane protein CFEM domain-containing protein n=1 Tax=Sclerotinia borealis (strain F-4128) TaxID=1432307 RepID=W9CAL3_SCLBF|nr:hypothetical protein SBOR_5843 [Sclerotinia borealis F-4128]
MAILPSSLLLLIYVFSTYVNADFSLPSEVTSFIPACAQICFESFIQDNYPTSVCGDTPTLDCICENGSKSTYTVGEGAVQCIMSEASVGFCNGDDSSNDTVLQAYDMCNSDQSALPNTHSTLTATLVLQSGSASIVQIAPVATTSASGSVATTLHTTAPTATPSSTTNSKPSTGVPQPAAATSVSSSPEKSRPMLSTAQIAGIVVAGVGGIVLAVGAILLFACMRRKKQVNRDSGYLPFQQDPSMSIKSQSHFGITKPMAPSPDFVSSRGPTPIGPFLGARMPPRIPPRGDQPSPDPFSQRNPIPENIGLAMTSESPQNFLLTPMGYTEEVFQRGPSPLLPERPTLTLQVPFQTNSNNIHTAAYQQPSSLAGNNRQSMVTQFEDEDTCSTAVASDVPWNAASYGSKSNEKVLQQPDPAYYQPSRLQGELSPNVSESIINSYKDPSVEPDFYVRPLNLQRNFSQPRRPENAMKPPVSRNLSINDPLTASSSVYSAKSRMRRPSSIEVDRLNSLMQSNPSFRRVLRKSAYNPAGQYDQNRTSRASVGSMTSFETIDSINPEPQELAGDTNLSPVVESPSDNLKSIGKSPVKYPITKGNSNLSHHHSRNRTHTSIITNFPAPPPISIESPICHPVAQSNKPWQEAEIAAQKLRMTSLGLSPGKYLSPGSHNSAITIRKSSDFFNPTNLALRSPPPPIPLPLPPNRQRDISPIGMGAGGGKRNAPPTPLSLASSLSNTNPSQNSKWRILPDTNTTTSHKTTLNPIAVASPHWRPQVLTGILRKDSVQSLNNNTTPNNQSLNPTTIQDPEASSIYSQETRKFNFDPRLTQMTTMSDMRAQGQMADPEDFNANASSNQDINPNFNPNTNTNSKPVVYTKTNGSGQVITINTNGDHPSALPKTPGWVPKLTPTRRGNDLFLKVQ